MLPVCCVPVILCWVLCYCGYTWPHPWTKGRYLYFSHWVMPPQWRQFSGTLLLFILSSSCRYFPFFPKGINSFSLLWGHCLPFLEIITPVWCIFLAPVLVLLNFLYFCLGSLRGWVSFIAEIVTFGLSASFWVIKSWKWLTKAGRRLGSFHVVLHRIKIWFWCDLGR